MATKPNNKKTPPVIEADVKETADLGEVVDETATVDEIAEVPSTASRNAVRAAEVVTENGLRFLKCQGLVNHKCSIGDQKRIIIEKNKPVKLREDVAVILQRSQKVVILG